MQADNGDLKSIRKWLERFRLSILQLGMNIGVGMVFQCPPPDSEFRAKCGFLFGCGGNVSDICS
jgi:hypothetical protein